MVRHTCNKEHEITEIAADVKYLVKSMDEIKNDVKENTEFRIKANGIIGAVAFVASVFGGFIMWIITKIRGNI